MADDNDDDDGPRQFVDFKQRPEWKDVIPIPQDEGPNPICPIAYTYEFTQTMDYFRAILSKDERSERALALTAEVIAINAANYTAWHFRRLCLLALRSDLRAEMLYVNGIAKRNPKNYQLWYHRRWLVEQGRDASAELEFTAHALSGDDKNYHAWAHRQWVLGAFGLWADELRFVEQMLKTDPRNNSAWNQRFFVLTHTTGLGAADVLGREVQFAFSYIALAPNNQSPWAYLKGVLMASGKPLSSFTEVADRVAGYMSNFPSCSNAVALLFDMAIDAGNQQQRALELCEKLIKIDQIHEKYWLWTKATMFAVAK